MKTEYRYFAYHKTGPEHVLNSFLLKARDYEAAKLEARKELGDEPFQVEAHLVDAATGRALSQWEVEQLKRSANTESETRRAFPEQHDKR
jgi:hypothetical protein